MSRMDRRRMLQVVGGSAVALRLHRSWSQTAPRLRAQVSSDADLASVLTMARRILSTGLAAGTGYPEVWIRDLNTFLEFALGVADPSAFRTALTNFFLLQGPDGDIVDGYVAANKQQEPAYRISPLLPHYAAHKNTVETDQESSLTLAVSTYVRVTHDTAFLDQMIEGLTVRERLGRALSYPLSKRFDGKRGLVWGGTTIDWGDVAPERFPGTRLYPQTHRAIGVYHNALLACAIREYVALPGTRRPEQMRWNKVHATLKKSIRKHLWDDERLQFQPHVYLEEGSPFPASFDEASIYMHGGTTVAMEADLLTLDEVRQALQRMRDNVRAAGASSIGLTIYPTYPNGFYTDPILTKPYTYQNGGDWCWFGGRTVQQLVRHGMLQQAYEELKPMVARAVRHGGFYEWWTPSNQPRGSGDFRGSAGVLGQAILMLQRALSAECTGCEPRGLKSGTRSSQEPTAAGPTEPW